MKKEENETGGRGLAKTRDGIIVSSSMDKTVVVGITAYKKHPQYGKFLKRTIKYYAHDEENTCDVGDLVRIVETRPLSKKKRWRVRSVIEKAI